MDFLGAEADKNIKNKEEKKVTRDSKSVQILFLLFHMLGQNVEFIDDNFVQCSDFVDQHIHTPRSRSNGQETRLSSVVDFGRTRTARADGGLSKCG